MDLSTARPRVIAVLGPTNTGKTYLAVERMLGHASGMIGFPLRLLARENYDRVVAARGARSVALVTGEEKIVPPNPRYWVCTVESMPLERPVDFLAVDEIQLAADPERGHVFTQRLLHARGRDETMFLGSDTIRPLVRRLVPEAELVGRPRFSTLTYIGPKKITRLPRRSAVVAFSAADVYGIAELLRRQRGGTAVVLGALSPRTRNAQVEMYQSGEVDYLVATDAIGMGLNMDLDHVAFARLSKFDGVSPRRLTAPEVAQIAGRAGRHMNDGTFGTTAEVGPLDPELVFAVEEHRFDPLKAIYWRNTGLRFSSARLLLKDLERPPPSPGLMRVRDADDHLALAALVRDPAVLELADTPAAVRLLWEVCQIPDYRKTLSDAHTRLLAAIYRYLTSPAGRLPDDWVANHIARLDRTDGDIDALAARIAHIRTWTFVAHRGDWVRDPAHWQERALAVEDRLSDALHDRLTQRFVDTRAATLLRRLKDREQLLAAVDDEGDVLVEGQYVGRLDGFRFRPDAAASGEETRALMGAARRALRTEIAARLRALGEAPDAEFGLGADGRLAWRGVAVARLVAGRGLLAPRVEPLSSDLLTTRQRDAVRRRLARWFEAHLAERLGPLMTLRTAAFTGPARGLAFQLVESLGSLPRHQARAQIDGLGRGDRRAFRGLGVRFGREDVYLPALLKPGAVALRALLWAVHHERALPPPLPAAGAVSVGRDDSLPGAYYQTIGFRPCGPRAIRVDALERIAAEAWRLSRGGAFRPTQKVLSLAGCGADEVAPVLTALGYRAVANGGDAAFVRPPRRARRPARRRGRPRRETDSPFAKLKELTLSS